MTALRLAWTELTRFASGPLLRRLVPLALVLIPSLYGGLYLWSNWDPYGHLNRVPVAVVNEDRAVDVRGKHVAAGDQFVAELQGDDSLGWAFVDAQTAQAGVRDGVYAFAVVVPPDFSAKLTSPLTEHPQRAEVRLVLNDANGYISGKIAETVELELKNKIDSAAFQAYAEGVLDALLDLHDQLGAAADGAAQLTAGERQAEAGAEDLAGGLDELAAGGATLADVAHHVADG
ncbi:MAG: ABC transporter, partial [Hamadaea sp.]|nr:ABC transporter [Hamadaea sp.]